MMNLELLKVKQMIKKISHGSFFGIFKWQTITFYGLNSENETLKGESQKNPKEGVLSEVANKVLKAKKE